MKNLFILPAILCVTFLFSCNKEKSKLKDIYGTYYAAPFIIHTDGSQDIYVNSVGIDNVGVGMFYTLPSEDLVPGCEFDLLSSDNSAYDYKLIFKRTRLFVLNVNTGEMVEQPSPSEAELNAGKSFYLSKTGDENTLLLNILYDNGTVNVVSFNKS